MDDDSEEQPCLPLAFLANLRVSPGSEKERRMTVGSGRRLLESWPKSNQPGPSLKTLVEFLVLSEAWYSRICYLRWKPKVMKSSRLLFQLAPSMPRTGGTGSGLLLMTPEARNQEGYQISAGKKWPRLGKQIAMLPTPRAEKQSPQSREDFTPNLAARISMLPTPRGADGDKGIRTLEGHRKERERRGQGIDLPTAVGTKPGLKLQPAFVEWMMGFPNGWTDLKLSAMRLSRKSHMKSSKE